ncbi:hypothetical protein [Nocardia inohanensis]|uniref:hypothetical protein n=1 Tax=Nocardia inohanensis TaxID=209246 RepID=UPI0012FB679A|nr:hypothetical protein [Nocardia inohanensis]
MSGTVRATSKLVGDAASIAGEIRARLNAIASDGRAAVAAGQSAWGDDEFGGKFADGEKGFVVGTDNITSGTDNLGTSFGNLAKGLAKAETTLRNMELKNKNSFRYR